jgi:hypothetical protein
MPDQDPNPHEPALVWILIRIKTIADPYTGFRMVEELNTFLGILVGWSPMIQVGSLRKCLVSSCGSRLWLGPVYLLLGGFHQFRSMFSVYVLEEVHSSGIL